MVIKEANQRLELNHVLKTKHFLTEEEIHGVSNEGIFDRFKKSNSKFEQAEKEIEQTDFNDLFVQPQMDKETLNVLPKYKYEIISQLKKRITKRLPTLISIFPNLVSGNTLYSLKSKLKDGQIIDGFTLGNLGTYIVDEYLIIDNDVAKMRLNKKLSDLN